MAQHSRTDTLMFVCLMALCYGYLIYGIGPPVVCYFYGKEATATITRYVPRQDDEGHRIHDHVFSYDGHVEVHRFSRAYPVGHQRQMLYLPDRPSWVVSGSRDDPLWVVIDKSTNGYVLAITCVVGLLVTMETLRRIRDARRGEDAA